MVPSTLQDYSLKPDFQNLDFGTKNYDHLDQCVYLGSPVHSALNPFGSALSWGISVHPELNPFGSILSWGISVHPELNHFGPILYLGVSVHPVLSHFGPILYFRFILHLVILAPFCTYHHTHIPRHGKGPESWFFVEDFGWRKIFRWFVLRV